MPQQLEELGFTCGACGKQFRWKPELAGRSVTCKCETMIRVPGEAGGVAQAKAVAAAVAVRPGPGNPSAAPVRHVKIAAPARHASTVPAKPRSRPSASPPPPPVEDDPFAALNALAEQEAASADGAADQDEATRCPNCRGFLDSTAIVCTSCGFDRRKGKVLATATAAPARESGKRGLFGFGKPKPADPNNKQVIDKMAPQGSFVIGLGASVALAALASVVWFGVAYAFDLDVFYLVLLVGGAAGLGMQIGQKGYSTLGGLAAACVALVVILAARVAVVVAVLLPLLRMQSGEASGEDSRVIMTLMAAEYESRGLDSDETTFEQDQAVGQAAERKASALSVAEKQQIIADADRMLIAEPDVEIDAATGASAIFMLVIFGGIKSFLFLMGALFLAFRTASGSVSG